MIENDRVSRPDISDATTSIRNALRVHKTAGFVFRQCFLKGQYRKACNECEAKAACLAGA